MTSIEELEVQLARQNDLREKELSIQRELAVSEFQKAQAIAAQTIEASLTRRATEEHNSDLRLLTARITTLIEVMNVIVSDDRIGNVQVLLTSILPVIMRMAGSQEEIHRLERLIERTAAHINVAGSVQGDVAGSIKKEK